MGSILKGNKGESLVSVMVAAAIFGIIIAGIMTSLGHVYAGKKNINFAQDAGLFKTQLQTFFNNDEICTAGFKGRNYSGLVGAAEEDLTFVVGASSGDPINVSAGATVSPGVRIKSVKIRNAMPGSLGVPLPIKPNAGSATIYARKQTAYVQVILEKEVNGVYQDFGRPIVYATQFLVKPDNLIDSCVNSQGEKDYCASIGGTWITDPNTNGPRCVEKAYCTAAGYFSDPSAKTPFVNHITGGYTCPQGSIRLQNGVITGTASCGKDCATSNYAPTYECLYCADSTMAGAASVTVPTSPAQNLLPSYQSATDMYDNLYNTQTSGIAGQAQAQ